MGVEKTKKEDYGHLFKMGDRVEQMNKKDIETILLEVCNRNRDLLHGRKITALENRYLSQADQGKITEEKAAAHRKKTGIILESLSIIGNVGHAIAGASPVGGIFQVAAQAFQSSAQYKSRITDGDIQVLTHQYQLSSNSHSDFNKHASDSDREHEQNTSTLDRVMQSQQRMFELVTA